MSITLNGETHHLPPHRLATESLHTFIMQHCPELQQAVRFAVERNGAIVPKSQLSHTALADGDVIEIVIAVGGG